MDEAGITLNAAAKNACHCEDHEERSDVVGRGNPFCLQGVTTGRRTARSNAAKSQKAKKKRPSSGAFICCANCFFSLNELK